VPNLLSSQWNPVQAGYLVEGLAREDQRNPSCKALVKEEAASAVPTPEMNKSQRDMESGGAQQQLQAWNWTTGMAVEQG